MTYPKSVHICSICGLLSFSSSHFIHCPLTLTEYVPFLRFFFLHWAAFASFPRKLLCFFPTKQNITVFSVCFCLQIVISSKPKVQWQFQTISIMRAGVSGVCRCIIAKSSMPTDAAWGEHTAYIGNMCQIKRIHCSFLSMRNNKSQR